MLGTRRMQRAAHTTVSVLAVVGTPSSVDIER